MSARRVRAWSLMAAVAAAALAAEPAGAAFDTRRVTPVSPTSNAIVHSGEALVEATVAPNGDIRPSASAELFFQATRVAAQRVVKVSRERDENGRWHVGVARIGPLRLGVNTLRLWLADNPNDSSDWASIDIPVVRQAVPKGVNVFATSVEVTQAIQGPLALYDARRRSEARSLLDYPGSGPTAVPLVAGKRTAVRVAAAVEGSSGRPVGPIFTKLTASRNGTVLGTLHGEGITLEGAGTAPTEPGRLRARARNEEALTWNFMVPDDWTRGDVSYDAEVNSENIFGRLPECAGCFDAANTARVQVRYQRSGFVALLPWKVVHLPTGAQVSDLTGFFRFVQRLYPVADEDVLVSGYRGTLQVRTRVVDTVLDELDATTSLAGVPTVEFTGQTSFVGVLPDAVQWIFDDGEDAGGLAEMSGEDMVTRGGPNVVTAAHELGHNIGLDHADCDHGERGCDPSFPTPHGSVESSIHGFDTYDVRAIDAGVTLPGGPGGGFLRDSVPHDMMSYQSGNRWISRVNYLELLDYLRTHAEERPRDGLAQPARQRERPGRRILVGGTLDGDRGEITSLYQAVSKPRDSLPASGPYRLVVLDAAGNVLVARDFDARVGETTGATPFRVILPAVANAARVELRRGDAVLSVRNRSASPPTVRWTDPPRPRPLGRRGVRTVAWTSGDGDGDALTYVLQYSRDGGRSWRTIDSAIPDLSYQLDTSNLEGTRRGRFRVLASDGFHTTSDDSDRVFPVPDKAPQPTITAPAAGEPATGAPTGAPSPAGVTLTAGSSLQLDGSAFDFEDGALGDRRLRWISSRDGLIGRGRSARWASPSIGRHTVTLVAIDSAGRTGTAQTVVVVTRATVARGAPRVVCVRAQRRRLTIRFSEPVTGVGDRAVAVSGPGRTTPRRISVSADRRRATMHGLRLRRGGRYRVRISGGVTDVAGNALRATSRRLRAR